jgi:hypothetical protein
MRQWLMRFLALAFICACGGGSSPGSLVGTVHGVPLKVGDAVSASIQVGATHVAAVEIVSSAHECADSMDPPIRHPL